MIRATTLLVLAMGLAAPWALAQRDPGVRGDAPERRPPLAEGPRGEPQELLEHMMLARMARELDLSDEQLVKIVRGLGDFRQRLHGLAQERAELMRNLRAAVNGEKTDTGATLDALLRLDERLYQVRTDMHNSLRGLLTPEQHARVYLFLAEFDGQMMGLLDRARERGLLGPPPEGPRPRDPGLRDRPLGAPERPNPPALRNPAERRDGAAPEISDERRELLRKLMERRRSELRDTPAPRQDKVEAKPDAQ